MPEMDTSLPKIDQFLAALEGAVADGSFVRLALRLPFGADETLRSVDIKPVIVRGDLKLSFTFHHQTRDLTQNHPPAGAIGQLKRLMDKDFRQAFLFATTFDLQFDSQGKTPRLKRTEFDEQGPGLAGARPRQGPPDPRRRQGLADGTGRHRGRWHGAQGLGRQVPADQPLCRNPCAAAQGDPRGAAAPGGRYGRREGLPDFRRRGLSGQQMHASDQGGWCGIPRRSREILQRDCCDHRNRQSELRAGQHRGLRLRPEPTC